jgi:hypothetical protein
MKYALMVSAAFVGLAAVPATAMPIASLNDSSSGLTLAAWGCGPGWTRGPYGHCHPMGYGPGPAYGFYARLCFGVREPIDIARPQRDPCC